MSEELDVYFMKEAYSFARKNSQNPKTNTGVIIVDCDGKYTLSYGANRFPNGIPYDSSKLNPPEVYDWLEHAERNAICKANCEGLNSYLVGAKIYSPWIPCVDCAREIVNYSLGEVIIHRELNDFDLSISSNKDWKQDVALDILNRRGVNVRTISGKLFDSSENFFINFRGHKFFP